MHSRATASSSLFRVADPRGRAKVENLAAQAEAAARLGPVAAVAIDELQQPDFALPRWDRPVDLRTLNRDAWADRASTAARTWVPAPCRAIGARLAAPLSVPRWRSPPASRCARAP